MKSVGQYLENPKLLREQIKKEQQLKDLGKLDPSYPDPYAWRMTRYKGFISYPERLKNFGETSFRNSS